MNRLRRGAPAIVLVLLAPFIGEVLSTSAPPAEFFTLFSFVTLVVLYGVGALLIREATFRWARGWPTVLMLGAAYGIAEEGLIVASFSNPNWQDLGNMSNYGRLFGIQWGWAVHLTLFHMFASIAIPILLTELVFLDRRGQAWIGPRTFRLLTALWLTNAVILAALFVIFGDYLPPLIPYAVMIGVCLGLIWLAKRLPVPKRPAVPGRLRHPFWFWLVGFVATTAHFLVAWLGSENGMPPIFMIVLLPLIVVVAGWLVLKMMGRGLVVSPRHQLALASGVLTFMILLSPLAEADPNRTDNTDGLVVMAVLMVVFLLWLRRRVRKGSVLPDGG